VAGDPAWPLSVSGIRPGEKVHEILVSEEEARPPAPPAPAAQPGPAPLPRA